MRVGIFILMCLLVITSTASAELVGGYVFDGTATTSTPSTVSEIGGNTSLDLTLGGTTIYTADTPFTYNGNTALDVLYTNDRAWNGTTTAYQFELRDDAFSVAVWVNFTASGSYNHIVGQRKLSTGNGWYVGVNTSNQPFLFTQGQTSSDGRVVTGTSALNNGQWHHIVAISDPASDLDGNADGELFMYVDGVLDTTYKKTQTELTDYGNAAFSVGSGYDLSVGSFKQFAGLIDELAIYNHALTAAEVTGLYSATIPIPTGWIDGDANHDGVVSADDYACIQINFGDTGDRGIVGDANSDGVVSASDFASVQTNFGNVAAPQQAATVAVVPEPATVLLMITGGLMFIRRMKR